MKRARPMNKLEFALLLVLAIFILNGTPTFASSDIARCAPAMPAHVEPIHALPREQARWQPVGDRWESDHWLAREPVWFEQGSRWIF